MCLRIKQIQNLDEKWKMKGGKIVIQRTSKVGYDRFGRIIDLQS